MTASGTSARTGVLARMGWSPTPASAQRPGQVGIALKMWTNVRPGVPLAAETGVPARTRLAASIVFVLVAGEAQAVRRTSMTVLLPPVPQDPPALTAWAPSPASAHLAAQAFCVTWRTGV